MDRVAAAHGYATDSPGLLGSMDAQRVEEWWISGWPLEVVESVMNEMGEKMRAGRPTGLRRIVPLAYYEGAIRQRLEFADPGGWQRSRLMDERGRGT